MKEKLSGLKGGLIVSCQALEDEPLHSSFIMGRMARAAKEGGAVGIRANTVEDICEICKNVDLPVIGIIKSEYPDSEVYITPTMKEVDALMNIQPDIIALDATKRVRPDGVSLDAFFSQVREKYPEQMFMADCSSIEEAVHADAIGFDFIGTTMVGYTSYTKGDRIEADTFGIVRTILKEIKHPLIAEGNIDTPGKAREVLDLGCFSVVVGGAITRPQLITRKFVDAIKA
ncbi:MAG: N-acetylmannosamine-6-phosphate 2-epimerase [Oribacterium sp.]|nr:N-acetylmannosamine-6-phosphate 2-epimerase [Oribacterium sp.]